MKRLLLFLLFPILALAAGTTANVSWTAPAQYNDGTVLQASEIAFYTIQWTNTGGVHTVVVNAPALSTVVNVACGSATFVISVTTTATAQYPNASSDPSGPVPYATGITCKPNTPTGLKVT